jgi:hypothetical protein
MTLRLDDTQAHGLATVAAVDGKPVSEVIREAITAHLRTRCSDPAFTRALREHIAEAQ